ncbi:MAG: hypothetical protein JRI46_06260 [Deltaproteobacteria bacterium]|nr:hypothetical protein [Deltaproteobacteria bacterium]
MKKCLVIGLVLGLAVALASPVWAIDWSATGFIRVGTFLYRNITQMGPTGPPTPAADQWDDTNSYVNMRARLKLKAAASKDLYGVFHFEWDASQWGSGAGANWIGAWGADQVGTEVKNLYIDFKVPQAPVWLRAGVQACAIRPLVFMFREGPGITARVKIDPIKMMIRPMWFKRWEGTTWRADDTDIYAVDMSLPVGPVKVGGFFLYENAREFPLTADDGRLWWLGANSDGKIGPVKYNFDFVYSGGEWEYGAAPDVDYKGWMIRAVASYTWNKFNFGIGGWYSRGDDRTSNDYEGYALPEGFSETPAINSDILILTGGWNGTGNLPTYSAFVYPVGAYGYLSQTACQFGGFWYLRGFANFQVTDWLKLLFQVAYIGDTTEDGDTFGRSVDAAGNPEDNDDIGFEFDVGASIKIYKNLTYNIAFGYLVAGDALDQYTGVGTINDDPKDPWALVTVLAYTF